MEDEFLLLRQPWLVAEVVVVPDLDGAAAQATAIDEHAELLAAGVAPVGEMFQDTPVPLDVAADVEGVEDVGDELHGLGGFELHVDAGPDLHLRIAHFQDFCDVLGGRRDDFRKQITPSKILHHAVDLPAQILREGVLAVAIGVEQQIQLDAVFAAPRQIARQLLDALLHGLLQMDDAAGHHAGPGEKDLLYRGQIRLHHGGEAARYHPVVSHGIFSEGHQHGV